MNEMSFATLQMAITESFWGKFDHETDTYHGLANHCADVAACFQALLQQPTINRRLATSAELTLIPPDLVSRLAAICFLHDLGKAAIGFQTQVWSGAELNGLRRPQKKGHVETIASLLYSNRREDQWVSEALQLESTYLTWDRTDGCAASSLLLAAISHHGRPVRASGNAAKTYPDQWAVFGQLDPRSQVSFLHTVNKKLFPTAFDSEAGPLPTQAAFHHFFAGLCALADWLGSDRSYFVYSAALGDDYFSLACERAERVLGDTGLAIDCRRPTFSFPGKAAAALDVPVLRPLQSAILQTPLWAQAVILEAETGAGKTEAALLRFLALYEAGEVDSLYFAVPTRSAALQLHRRVHECVVRLLPGTETVLAVPGYLRAGTASGKALPEFEVLWDDDPHDRIAMGRWAAENSRRYTAAQVAVGTVDQIMLSALQVKHAHMRSAALRRSLIVIDELHASDTYMDAIIARVVQTQVRCGGHTLMMSATLGAHAREHWLAAASGQEPSPCTFQAACDEAYPLISYATDARRESLAILVENASREISVSAVFGDEAALRSRASQLALSSAEQGAKVLIIRNTVAEAVATFAALQEDDSWCSVAFCVAGVPCLHHSRFSAEDRERLDAQVEADFGKTRAAGGCVLIGTQTLEQSLDIDADLMLTDLCPMDVLLQRIGRLHRHDRARPQGFSAARCIIMSPGEDLAPLLTAGRQGLGPNGYVYPDLRTLQLTQQQILAGPVWRVPQMNRRLVESAVHPDRLAMVTTERGWEAHEQALRGDQIANGQTAADLLIRQDDDFCSEKQQFAGVDQKIRTRLGADSVAIRLATPEGGPFGTSVRRFAIPQWMLEGPLEEYESSPKVNANEEGLTLEFPSQSFLYTATGLHRLPNG